MNQQAFLDALTHTGWGRPLLFFEETDSTNTQAMKAATAGEAGHGAAVVALRQAAGRGTDGNRWESDPGAGLSMSLVLRVDGPLPAALALMPAVAVATVLRNGWGVDAHLKWPNDVMIGERKIAGILVETRTQAHGTIAVVGIGVNLNQERFAGELRDIAVSARMVLGRCAPLPAVFGSIVAACEQLWRQPAAWVGQWLALSRMIGRVVELSQDGSASRATVTGLSPEGFLCVRDESGESRVIQSRRGLDVRVKPLPSGRGAHA